MTMLGFRPMAKDGVQGLMKLSEVTAECPHHVDSRCDIYQQRPVICQEWPQKPEQVRNTPCSYWFEDEAGMEKPIGGEGSAYGVQTIAQKTLEELAKRIEIGYSLKL